MRNPATTKALALATAAAAQEQPDPGATAASAPTTPADGSAPPSDPALAARVDALARELAETRAEVAALRKAAEGHDVSIKAAGHDKDARGGASFADFAANAKALSGNKD